MADLGFKIKIDGVETTVNTLGEVKQAIKDLTAEAKKADLGSDAYKEAIAGIREAKTQLKEFAIESKAHTTDVKGSHIQMANGIRTSLEGASNAMSVFGANSEAVAKATETSTSVLTAMNSIREIGEIRLTGAMTVKLAVQTALNAVGTLGIGLIIAGVAALGLWIASVLQETEAEKEAARVKEMNNKLTVAGGEAAADASAKIDKQTQSFKLAKEGVITQERALAEYNETFGKSLGIAKTFQEAQDTFVKKGADYVHMMELQAKATALMQLKQEEYKASIKATTEDQTTWYDKTISFLIDSPIDKMTGQTYKAQKQVERLKDAQDDHMKNMSLYSKEYSKLTEEIERTSKATNVLSESQIKENERLEEEKKKKDDQAKEAAQKQKAAQDKAAAAYKQHLEEMKKLREEADSKLLALQQKFNIESIEDQDAKDMLVLKTEQKNADKELQIKIDLLAKKKKLNKEELAAYNALLAEQVQLQKNNEQAVSKLLDTQNKAKIKKEKDFWKMVESVEDEYYAKLAKDAADRKKKADKLEDSKKKHEIAMMKEGHKKQLAQFNEERRLRERDVKDSEASAEEKARTLEMIDKESKKRMKEMSREHLQNELNATADMLGSVASLFGEHTTAYKVAKVAQTLISTYSSAIKAFDSLSGIPYVGPILGGIAAAAAVAGGIAAIAKIVAVQATPAPTPEAKQLAPVASSYGLGGILQGSSHAQGGIMTPFGEVEGGEAVINKRSTSMHAGILSAINVSGGGQSFAPTNNAGGDNKASSTPILKTYVVASDMTTQQQANDKTKRLSRL